LEITKDNTKKVIIGGGNEIPSECGEEKVGVKLKEGICKLLNKYFDGQVETEIQPPLGCRLNLNLDCTKQDEYKAYEYLSRLNSPSQPECAEFAFNAPHQSYIGYDVGRPSVFNDGTEYKKDTHNSLYVRLLKSDSKKDLIEKLQPFSC